jgi:hypothetical protein
MVVIDNLANFHSISPNQTNFSLLLACTSVSISAVSEGY